MSKDELIKTTDLNWCLDILKRIDEVVKKSSVNTKTEDLVQIGWLVKQGLKVIREQD